MKKKMMIHGVTRTHNRGLPTKVIQKEGTNKEAYIFLACSIYDTKPVHILSSANVDVKWIVKTKNCMTKRKIK